MTKDKMPSNAKDILAKTKVLKSEEFQLKHELELIKTELDLSDEALISRKFTIEKKIHELRVQLSRLPVVEEVVPRFETTFSLDREEYQDYSESIQDQSVQFIGEIESVYPVDVCFTNDAGYSMIEENLPRKKSIKTTVETSGLELFGEQIFGALSEDFVFIASSPGTYHFMFDSPQLKKNETNKITLSYTGYRVTGTYLPETETPNLQSAEIPVIIHKEVQSQIIVRIPCRYCGQLNDQTSIKCSSCGASVRVR